MGREVRHHLVVYECIEDLGDDGVEVKLGGSLLGRSSLCSYTVRSLW